MQLMIFFCYSNADNTSGSSPKPLEPSLESVNEKTEMESDVSTLNNRETNTSPKRPNEEPNSNPKKKVDIKTNMFLRTSSF